MAPHQLLAAARRARSLPQSVVAQRSGEAVPNLSSIENGRRVPRVDTLDRILRAADASLLIAPTTRMSALESSVDIRDSLRGGDRRRAFRAWLSFGDALAAEGAVNRVVLAAFPPQATGDPVFDAALAAIVDYRLREVDAPIPEWVNSGTPLPEEVVFADSLYVRRVDAGSVPHEFRRRGLLISREALASV